MYTFFVMNKLRKHLTLSYLFAVLLCLLGGFVEIYSVKTRGIYAAMQTGNIINFFMDLIDNKIALALDNLLVIAMFFVGCVIGEGLRIFVKKKGNNLYEPLILILMVICLIPTICLPVDSDSLRNGNLPTAYDLVANCFIALFGAFQLCAFQNMNGHFFVSTMMTMVLKNITTYSILAAKEREVDHIYTTLEYLFVLLSFILGAVIFYLCYQLINIDNKDFLLQMLPIGALILTCVLFGLSFKAFVPKKIK